MYAVFCMFLTTFGHKKMVPEDVFRWTFALQALTDFKPSELKGAEEVESSQRLKDVFCWGEMKGKTIGKPYETMNYGQIRV